jgi:hypothetical protein
MSEILYPTKFVIEPCFITDTYTFLVTVQNPLGELINFCTKQRIFKTCFAILFR